MTGTSTPDLSIVVLGYRAGEGLAVFIDSLRNSLSHRTEDQRLATWEIVVVANYWPGTNDETPAVAERLAAADDRIRVVARPKEGAMGWDMRSGLAAANGRYLAVIDGDGQMPADDVIKVYMLLRDTGADLAKTFRSVRRDGLYRRFISGAYNTLFSVLFPGLHSRDINSKPKVFTRAAYERMKLLDDAWFIDAEIMIQARRLGLRIEEVSTTFHPLEGRASFVRPAAILEFVRKLLTAFWRDHRRGG